MSCSVNFIMWFSGSSGVHSKAVDITTRNVWESTFSIFSLISSLCRTFTSR